MNNDDLDVVSAPLARTAAASTGKYWSAARMEEATPVAMPIVTLEEHQQANAAMAAEMAGVNTTSCVVAAPQLPANARIAPTSTPARQTNRVANMSAYPYSTALKMFMSFGDPMIGSAIIIGRRAVLTAGHCVWDKGNWASNIQFVPRFQRGSRPVGTFNAVNTTTLREYTQLSPAEGKYHYDLAVCVVDKDFPAELGIAGYALNRVLSPGKLRSIGYPGQPYRNFPFDGQDMWTSLGDYWDEGDRGRNTTLARNYGHYNDMTGGCSGGPIFSNGPVPIVVGLNSHVILQYQDGPREEPPRMYSPFFGDPMKRLINFLERNGGFPNQPRPQDEPDVPSEPDTSLKDGLTQVVQKLQEIIERL